MSDWNEKEAYLAARRLPQEQREPYLRSVCPDEAAVRSVLELLARDESESLAFLPDTAEPPASVEETTGEVVGQYRLLRQLGEGGMGIVFLAEHLVLGKRFALKFLKVGLASSERAAARFVEEAKTTARLNHPAIVQVVDVCREGQRMYIVSEFVDGPTLTDVIEEERARAGSQPQNRDVGAWTHKAAEIIGILADALEAAHRVGIVHCDVKPSNILVDQTHGARLSDFGIARHLVQEAPSLETLGLLTPWYASPEQASIAAVDQRSDVFSLGVVLYEMLTLRRPFVGRDLAEVLDAIKRLDPPTPRSIDRRIPRDLETICLRAIEKSPLKRYQSAAYIASELRSVREGKQILTPPRSVLRRLTIAIQKHRKLFGVATVVMIIGTAIALGIQLRNMRIATLGAISIEAYEGSPSGGVVSVLTFNDQTRDWETPRSLGSLPLRLMRLEPGLYRFRIVDGASISECDEYLPAGTTVHRKVWLRERAIGEERMSGFDAGTYKVDYRHPLQTTAVHSTPPLEAFLMDLNEVTNEEYAAFVAATGHPSTPEYWDDNRYRTAPERFARLPVVDLARSDMEAYALWAGKRLPTIDEWMAAAQSPDGRRLPWESSERTIDGIRPSREMILARHDNDPAHQRDYYFAYVRSAGDTPEPATNSGLRQVYGNVMEMTGSIVILDKGPTAIVAGGMWADDPEYTDLDQAALAPIGSRSFQQGFRCVKSMTKGLISGRK